MTTYDSRPGTMTGAAIAPPTWVRILLGLVLIVAGIFVLGDLAIATLVSTIFIAIMAIAAGVFEIIHAFWTKGWGGFIWQIVLGILYIAFGVALWNQPVLGALFLTYVLGLVFLISGFVRVVVSFGRWKEAGWIMLLSGLFGILAGLIVLSGFPATGLWVLGALLGIDLICHGVAWLAYAFMPEVRTA